MKLATLSMLIFSLSTSLGFVAGTAYDQRKPVSSYEFYEQSGFARVELRRSFDE